MKNDAKILSAIRKQIDLRGSQCAFARAVGVSPQYVSQLLNRKNPVGALSLDKLESFFPDELEIQFCWHKEDSPRPPAYTELVALLERLDEQQLQLALQMLQLAFR